MLEEALHEFLRREGALFKLSGVRSAVLEGDLGRLQAPGVEQADQTAIAKSHAVNIRCQIAESRLSIADRLAVYNPLLLPDFWCNLWEERCFLQQALEGGTKSSGERLHRQEEIMVSWEPSLLLGTPATTGHEVVHVRMVVQLAGPGMQDTHHPNLATHKARIAGEVLGGLCGSPKQQVVNELLVLASNLAELGGEAEGQQEIGNGQEQFALQLETFFSLFMLAFGAV